MSLQEKLPYPEYEQASNFTKEQCETIANLANLNITYDDNKKPGERLMKTLDRRGISVEQFRDFRETMLLNTAASTYSPNIKIAILIANQRYINLSKLGSPMEDCNCLKDILQKLGFVICLIENTKSCELKQILQDILSTVPEDSYVFVFYAGHGCEICNTKCMLGVDCPTDGLELQYCTTENFILSEMGKCEPELCVLIMDMCRVILDRNLNPKIFEEITNVGDYKMNGNLLICYSTQSSETAYELVEIECTASFDASHTYELATGDMARINSAGSQYVKALCSRLEESIDISSLLDGVHGDLEAARKKQRPIKIQCGVAKRSLYDTVSGDVPAFFEELKKVNERYKEHLLLVPLTCT